MQRHERGFTIVELLVVIAILVIVMVAGATKWMTQLQKGYDSRRKGDLAAMKTMLEQYFNDFGCYPDSATLNNAALCGSTQFLNQGMKRFVCDPESKRPYLYEPIGLPPCGGYRIFARLKNAGDGDITAVGCTPGACGTHTGVNYGLSSGEPLVP
jgi:prepilin-type N-terminal cleavage/methylation domain-containing protein